MQDETGILLRIAERVGRITLNRPPALHALTEDMCAAMTTALMAWKQDPAIAVVVIDHAGKRGFCAGGDIRMLARSGQGDGREARSFFRTEYRLNHLLHAYPKPVVAVMDGVTMGGGVGISAPARFRLATERTVLAMPEIAIGLFPDAGGGWMLARLPDNIGMWMALTGARLNARDCVAAGIATRNVLSSGIPRILAGIGEISRSPEAFHSLRSLLSLGHEASDGAAGLVPQTRERIRETFGHSRLEGIFEALRRDGSPWAQAQLKAMEKASPLSLKIAFRQIRSSANLLTFAENMAMEFRIACRMIPTHDFAEGVRAALLDKDQAPKWSARTIDEVSDEEVDAFFAALPASEEWTPIE